MKISSIVITKLTIILTILLLAGCKSETPKTAPSREIKTVRVTEVFPKEISMSVTAGGFVSPAEEIRLSFKTGGIIENINFKEGALVRGGNILASLNLSEINSHVIQARTAFEKAQRDFNRANNLYRDSVATLEQVQNAEAGLNIAKSNFEIAEFNLQHSRIIAPSDGIVLKQLAKSSELIAPGYPVFLFGVTGKNWRVKAGVADRDVVKINTGDSASVIMDAYPGEKFSGFVNQVGEMANTSTGTYEVEILLDRTTKRLVSGFVASVSIFLSHEDPLILIPVESLVEAEGKTGFVFALTSNNTVEKTGIEIISLTDSGAVISSLPEDLRRIVNEGAAYLIDGDTVSVIR